METENRKTFKELRKERGISAIFVAKKLSITPQALYNKEKGKTSFTFNEGVTYCNILNVSMNDVAV